MVDKNLTFIAKDNNYGIIKKINPMQNIEYNVLYSDGNTLKYGDSAEIFGAIKNSDFLEFMKAAVDETQFGREHYGFLFGYYPATLDNIEIKENEVYVGYAGVVNIVSKSDFYKLCLLVCQAQVALNQMNLVSPLEQNQLHDILSQLQDKLKKSQE
jgi:hypothetical protein